MAVSSVTDPKLSAAWAMSMSGLDRPAARIGYARVSSPRQNINLQLWALEASGCDAIYTDCGSGLTLHRRGLSDALAQCRCGDELVIWRLDRMGRNLRHLLELDAAFERRGIRLRVLSGQLWDSGAGQADRQVIYAMMAAIAAYESNVTSERTRAGLEAARFINTGLHRTFSESAMHDVGANPRLGPP